MSLSLAIVLVGLTSLAVAALLLPLLLRRGRTQSRDAHNLAVYRDQLAEIERDITRGLLSGEQAGAARAEIGRRILALAPEGDGDVVANPRRIAAATVAILVLPVAALLIYAQLGSPALPDLPFADRGSAASDAAADNSDHVDMNTALAQLRAHLKTHPDDLTGWLLLARSELGLGQYQDSVDAYRRASDLSGQRADIVASWGEAQVLAANGTVTPAARQAFEAALKDPEAAPKARYYLALAQMQQGDVKGALQAWRALAADSPTDAAWLPLVNQRIAEASASLNGVPTPTAPAAGAGAASTGSMPPPASVAAAQQATAGMSAAERRTMIDGMVAKLAGELQQHPDDLDGWVRLGRSYMVLGQPDKARDAFAHAVRLKPDDAALKEALAQADGAAAAKPTPTAPPQPQAK